MHQSEKPEDIAGTQSLWTRTSLPAYGEQLVEDTSADVVVIGAGISGLTTAYQCLTRGHSVVVLEGGTVGAGETLRTSAHLANALDDHFTSLERLHGRRGARLLAEAHGAAIDWIATFVAAQQIPCDFARVDGYLYRSARDPRDEPLRDELEAARRAGLDVSWADSPVPELGTEKVLKFTAQAEIDAGAYVKGLASAVVRAGGRIHEGSVVERIDEGKPSKVVLRGGRTVTAAHVVVATNAPLSSMVSIPMKQAAYRTYVVALEIPKGRVPHGLYWDMEDPYHYVRVAADGDADREVLIVGGEDHKVGQQNDPAQCFTRLESWARERFPFAGAARRRWSGQIMEPADGAGFVGKNPGSTASVFVITGDSGNGLTLGTLGAHIVTDLIEGRRNAWSEVFDPSRSMLRAVGSLVRENANVAAQYADHVKPGDLPSRNDIALGQGAVIREGARLLAVYRDERGDCHVRSALCPHLEGVVHWNDVEKSWDCPCHGSRFDAFGRLIIGPATSDLPALEAKQKTGDAAPVRDVTVAHLPD